MYSYLVITDIVFSPCVVEAAKLTRLIWTPNWHGQILWQKFEVIVGELPKQQIVLERHCCVLKPFALSRITGREN